MPRTSADPSTPPALRALGGWLDATWFDPSILHESEVVGIGLPALPGCRKQSFDLAERSASQALPKRRAPAGAAPKPPPDGIVQILDQLGATRAAAFRRPRFFFEAAPTLYFAELPAANLKQRSADTLRRNLIANAFRGCVLRHGTAGIVGMFWPSLDSEITAFVRTAEPPYRLHGDFDRADDDRLLSEPGRRRLFPSGRATGDAAAVPAQAQRGASLDRERRRHQAERDRLLQELDGLRARIAELQRSQSATGAMETLGLNDARLKSMLRLLHPDRHGNSEAANEAAKWVNGLRDLLKARAAAP